MTSSHADAVTRLGFALSDGIRTRILLYLCAGPAYPSDLAEHLNVTRQVMSNQLACLRGCGLVSAEREGRRVAYELASPDVASALQTLLEATHAIDPTCCGSDAECVAGGARTCSCCTEVSE
ncbi:MAG: metalloregulator ArsR/SmtB family transcription factor [Bowdeniella nasicola]|nr:metalloregulator ArsR/SmtB family transcription factor [Bowdeniella nasicola]